MGDDYLRLQSPDMMNNDIWQFIKSSLQSEGSVMLMLVVESRGASPGKAGFKMAVTSSGERCGTIGGGVMEVNWVDRSSELLREGLPIAFVQELVHSRETQYTPSGLICSGSQTLLLKSLTIRDLETIGQIGNAVESRRSGVLKITPYEITFESADLGGRLNSFSYNSEREWQYEENVGILDTVYIIGSGHVGLALSRVMSTLDFRVVVVDDRPAVSTFVDNAYAHEKRCCSYEEVGSVLSENGREYVALVTTGYKSDVAALKAVIQKKVKYIGLMGSRAKTEQIFDDLRSSGITEDQLKHIHTPIGIQIASHTPAEIGVSIAAEIISVKNQSELP